MTFNNKLFSRILVHLLFWMLFIVTSLFIFSNYYWSENPFLDYIIILIIIVYLNNLVILPFFIRKKWYFLYFFVFGIISFYATQIYCNVFAECGCSIMKCLSDYLWQTLVPLIFFSFIWMIYQYKDKQEEIDEIKKAHTDMELKFLKSQINPHVLFNNLNTIYSYALEKPTEVPEMILMLSDNLKHVLYESNSKTVALENELQYINNYIQFQKIRTEGVKKVNYSTTIDVLNHQIPPLLLITIIENAFKYSYLNSAITINITVNNGILICTSENDYNKEQVSDNNLKIGLQNLKKRLQLIYKDDYTLDITKGEAFMVTLKLNLL